MVPFRQTSQPTDSRPSPRPMRSALINGETVAMVSAASLPIACIVSSALRSPEPLPSRSLCGLCCRLPIGSRRNLTPVMRVQSRNRAETVTAMSSLMPGARHRGQASGRPSKYRKGRLRAPECAIFRKATGARVREFPNRGPFPRLRDGQVIGFGRIPPRYPPRRGYGTRPRTHEHTPQARPGRYQSTQERVKMLHWARFFRNCFV